MHPLLSMFRMITFPLAFAAFLIAAPAVASDSSENTESQTPAPAELPVEASTARPPAVLFEQLTIVGGAEQVDSVPGSAHYISESELERHDYTDIHRILRQIPGVNIQEEEGFGLRPNIGMRGTGVERSQKITLMEDGVLIAPAPYSAPAAYYFPTAGRMEAVEVRKGSTSIIQGPYTTGGAINMISTSIPYDLGGRIEVSAGEYGTGRAHLSVGNSSERIGWMLETFQLRSDGFKDLDGGAETGFDLNDYVGKIRFSSSPSSRTQQALELKLGYVTQDGDETYLGLTDGDFELTPFRRYAGSQADRIDTEHEQIQLRHFFSRSAAWDVTTTAYRNDFFRNWYKLDSVGGISISSILANPTSNPDLIAAIRGERDDAQGIFNLRNNRRDYYSMGLQSVAAVRLGNPTGVSHQIEVGIRYHEDEEDRFQEDDRWGMKDGRMFLVRNGQPGTNANRIGSAEAIAVFVQDQISFGRLVLTPGVRFESIDFTRTDFGRNDPQRTGSSLNVRENAVEAWVPGLGVSYEISPEWRVFGGVHRGFAPPGPGSDARTRPEQSINYETGFRWAPNRFATQIVGFYNDYSNLLGRDTLSGGGSGTGDLFNGGEVEVKGVEASFEADLMRVFRGTSGRINAPVRLAYTWTDATFATSFETSFEDWGPAVSAGDRLPYLPENQWSLGAGLDTERWMGYATLNFTDEMLTEPGQGDIPATQRTDDYLTLDLSGEVAVWGNLRATAQLRNATGETYIVARRPAGVRPGMPRTLLLGVRWVF
jgi:Fe(3+) dicitrate transport protein